MRLRDHPADALPGESRDHPGREQGGGKQENGKQAAAHGASSVVEVVSRQSSIVNSGRKYLRHTTAPRTFWRLVTGDCA